MRTLLFLAPLALLPGSTAERGAATSAQEPAATTAQELAALIARFEKHDNDVRDAYDKADDAGRSQAEKDAIWAKRPGKEYIAEFRAIAEKAKGTETAVTAWLWVFRLTQNDRQEALRIVGFLLSEHMQSEQLAQLAEDLAHPESLRAMIAESPHERVRAGALFKLGSVLLERRSPEERAEGRDCMEAVIAEYGDVAHDRKTFGQEAEGHLYALDHLQIGMTAPDFEVVDENGVAWKLSDYRGKVVVVDFWGFW